MRTLSANAYDTENNDHPHSDCVDNHDGDEEGDGHEISPLRLGHCQAIGIKYNDHPHPHHDHDKDKKSHDDDCDENYRISPLSLRAPSANAGGVRRIEARTDFALRISSS